MKLLRWCQTGSVAALALGLLVTGCSPATEQASAPTSPEPKAGVSENGTAEVPAKTATPAGQVRTVSLRVEGMT